MLLHRSLDTPVAGMNETYQNESSLWSFKSFPANSADTPSISTNPEEVEKEQQ